MTVTIHTGDCQKVLRTLKPASVNTCVTSPPYFGLRDYDVPPSRWPRISYAPMAGMRNVRVPSMECALGLESTPEAFIAHLVHVFRAVRDVLREDGTLWLNLGDSYAGSWGAQARGNTASEASSRLDGSSMKEARRIGAYPLGMRGKGSMNHTPGLKPKDLMGIPWRVALALQADGWFLRQDIIWSKPNPMPESVRDRCTKSHEYLFLLSKSDRYYFDAEAIAEPLAAASIERLAQPNIDGQAGSDRVPGKTNGPMKAVRAKGNRKTFRGGGVYTQGRSFDNDAAPCNDSVGNEPNESDVRNRRSVWTVATMPFKEAHFATFPPALIEPCIVAASPAGGIVLDPFGGSGTTGKVAETLGRDSTLIELNPSYAAMAVDRTQQGGLVLKDAAA
jgi:DNA modification methylase